MLSSGVRPLKEGASFSQYSYYYTTSSSRCQRGEILLFFDLFFAMVSGGTYNTVPDVMKAGYGRT